MSPDDTKCEDIYKSSVYRETSSRFVVPLPFKYPNPSFGDTYSQALRRFTYLDSRLDKNPGLHLSYLTFIKEYIAQKLLSEVPRKEYCSQSAFYFLHHCVLKPDSVSTKIRVVYDTKGSNGISLNDPFLFGPTLHLNLLTILLKF